MPDKPKPPPKPPPKPKLSFCSKCGMYYTPPHNNCRLTPDGGNNN